jgi:hypothetical protein
MIETINHEAGAFSIYIVTKAKELENFPEEQLTNIIQTEIIPDMQERRGRDCPLTTEEVEVKIYGGTSSKPGEAYEYKVAMDKKMISPDFFTTEEALETADLIYYELQPNSAVEAPINWFLSFGDTRLLCILCYIKYKTRLRFGDRKNYKEIETYVMDMYLETLKKNTQYDWLFKGNKV